MRYRTKVNSKKSKRLYRRTVNPVIMNKTRRPGLKRGGTRL